MKVVYNACYGGFGLSKKAIDRYLELTGPIDKFYDRDIPRDDQRLIQVVEELGQAANGTFALLSIREVSSGTRWRIDEYDGYEQVMTINDYEWNIAN